MTSAILIVACLVLPGAGALALAVVRRGGRWRAGVGLVAAAVALASALALAPRVWAGSVPQLFIVALPPGVVIGMRVESVGLALALWGAGRWLWQCLRATRRGSAPVRARDALEAGALIGTGLAANLATIALFGALLTGLRGARPAWLAVAGALLAAATAATWALGGTLEFIPGSALHGGPGARALLLAAFLAGLALWGLAPARHAGRAAAAALAAYKVAVYIVGAHL